MRKILLATFVIGAVLHTHAADVVQNSVLRDDKVIIHTSVPGHFSYQPSPQTGSRADDEELWISAQLDMNPEEYDVNPYPLVFKPGEEGNFNYGYWDYDSAIDFYLPAGTYDILFNFTRKSDRAPFYVMRGVTVTEDGQEFTVSPAEADQLIEFDPRDPNGNPLSTDVIRLTDGEPDGTYSEGYLAVADQLFLVCSKQYGELGASSILKWTRWIENGEFGTNCIDKVYASASDDLFFVSGFGSVTHNASVACLLTSDGSRSQKITNTTDFQTFSQQFVVTPYRPQPDDNGNVFPKGHSCVNTYYICRDGVMGTRNRTVVSGERYSQEKIIV